MENATWLIEEEENGNIWKCSHCFGLSQNRTKYCPYCGQPMETKKETT